MNLRDMGYPSSMSPTVARKPLYDPVTRDYNTGSVYRGVAAVEAPAPDPTLLDRLVTAYNNKAFGANAPMIQKIDANLGGWREQGYAVRDRDGERLGYAKKKMAPDSVTYDVGLDNGNPDRGMLDLSVNTPMGTLGGGYEDEINYLSYETPNGDPYGFNAYLNKGGKPVEIEGGVGASDYGGKRLFLDVDAPFTQDRYNKYETPLGILEYGTNAKSPENNGFGYVDFTPNQYIQALMSLLNTKR